MASQRYMGMRLRVRAPCPSSWAQKPRQATLWPVSRAIASHCQIGMCWMWPSASQAAVAVTKAKCASV